MRHSPPHGNWLDVSVPLSSGMVHWPSDPPVRIEPLKEIRRDGSSNVSRLWIGSHTGTHVDAPRHYLARGATVDRMPVDAMMGPARVLGLPDPLRITRQSLARHGIRPGERLLLKTRNSLRCWQGRRFIPAFVHLAPDAAQYLAERRIRTLGIDYLSVGGYQRDGAAVHRALLGAGIWIIEGLNLSAARPGRYRLVCLPLKIAGGDGAPARVLLQRAS